MLQALHQILLPGDRQAKAPRQWHLRNSGFSILLYINCIIHLIFLQYSFSITLKVCRQDLPEFSPTKRFLPPYITQSNTHSTVTISPSLSNYEFLTILLKPQVRLVELLCFLLQMWLLTRLTYHLLQTHGDGLWYEIFKFSEVMSVVNEFNFMLLKNRHQIILSV